MDLVAFVVLGAVSAYLGLSDWKNRTVDIRGVVACCCAAACVNTLVLLDGSLQKDLTHMGGSIAVVAFLSGATVAFQRLGLLASGDALGVPAILAVVPLVLSPAQIILYFVVSLAIVLAASVTVNLHNNIKYREPATGSLCRRLKLMLLCYYGNAADCRHAFAYPARLRLDCDNEKYYSGEKKVWLVPALPLLAGFAPAILVLLI